MLCTFAYICICMQYALTCHAAWHGKQQTKRSIRSFIHESVLSFIAHVGVYVYGLCICLQHVLILHRLPREAVNKCKETTVHLRPPTRLVKHGALDALTKQLTDASACVRRCCRCATHASTNMRTRQKHSVLGGSHLNHCAERPCCGSYFRLLRNQAQQSGWLQPLACRCIAESRRKIKGAFANCYSLEHALTYPT